MVTSVPAGWGGPWLKNDFVLVVCLLVGVGVFFACGFPFAVGDERLVVLVCGWTLGLYMGQVDVVGVLGVCRGR